MLEMDRLYCSASAPEKAKTLDQIFLLVSVLITEGRPRGHRGGHFIIPLDLELFFVAQP